MQRMIEEKPTLEYANKSVPGDSRPARRLVIIVTAPFWWGTLERLIDPITDAIH